MLSLNKYVQILKLFFDLILIDYNSTVNIVKRTV